MFVLFALLAMGAEDLPPPMFRGYMNILQEIKRCIALEKELFKQELDNDYRAEKWTDKKGKKHFKNKLKHDLPRRKLNEEEKKVFFEKFMNKREMGLMRQIYCKYLNNGEATSLAELEILLKEKFDNLGRDCNARSLGCKSPKGLPANLPY